MPGMIDVQTQSPKLSIMNEKTAKLLNRFALAKGSNVKNLKREWNSMNSKERFLKRQEMLKDLKK